MKKNNWLDKYQDGGEQVQPQILQDFEKFRTSPEGKEYFKMMHDTQRAKDISGRIDYSDIDPITDLALPLVGIAGTIGKQAIKQGAKKVGKYLTEETALKNAYKLNPLAFKPDPEAYYRMLGTGEDVLESGLIRPNPNNIAPDGVQRFAVSHFSKGRPWNTRELGTAGYKGPYMAELSNYPMEGFTAAGWPKESLGHVPVDIPNVKLYKENWLKGYKEIPKQENGGITKDNMGYWNPDNWGHPVEIDSNQITMQGVNEPLLGISDTGDKKMMLPGKDYKFKGKKVREFPIGKNGLRQEQKSLQNLDNLVNFTNYNTKQPGGWLNKYSS